MRQRCAIARGFNYKCDLLLMDESAHSASGHALVYVTQGQVTITIGRNEPAIVKEGKMILMPANIPHGLVASENSKCC